MAKLVQVAPDEVQPGDLAEHRSRDLDPRAVTQVTETAVWIDILGSSKGPFPKHNYRFKRWVE